MNKPIITFTSDFGWMSQGIGIMKGVALGINPDANVVDITHEVKGFDIMHGARTMECLAAMPAGYHVCVVDPGVGTKRKPIIIKTGRGDYLVGPDNGVLIPAAGRFLGGIERAVEITNEEYMKKPVSPIFHGRDVFTPAAAWLSKGVPVSDFGPELDRKKLVKAPYGEAKVSNGKIEGMIIHVNHFGSLFVNVRREDFYGSGIKYGDRVTLRFGKKRVRARLLRTFGEVPGGKPVLIPDDYGRMEIALNRGDFSGKHGIKERDKIVIKKA